MNLEPFSASNVGDSACILDHEPVGIHPDLQPCQPWPVGGVWDDLEDVDPAPADDHFVATPDGGFVARSLVADCCDWCKDVCTCLPDAAGVWPSCCAVAL